MELTLHEIVELVSLLERHKFHWFGDTEKEAEAALFELYEKMRIIDKRTEEMPDCFYLALGWMFGECMNTIRQGKDLGGLSMSDMIERCKRDIKRGLENAD